MSDDLIRRSDAIKHCEIWRDRAKEAKDKEGWWIADNLLRLMKDTPTAEPKRGEWISKDPYWHTAICSNCNKVTMFEEWDEKVIEYDFCPNCGASMTEREGE